MIVGNKIYINNTYRSNFHACERKYMLSRICRLAPKYGSNALRYGSTWHGFMEGYYKHIQVNGWTRRDIAVEEGVKEGKKVWDTESASQVFNEDYRTFENCCFAFTQYLSTFPQDNCSIKVLHTERHVEVTIGHIIIDGEKYEVVFYGKLDLGIEYGGVKWLVDHKTTGASIDYMADRLKRSAQLMGYSWAGKSFDFIVEGMMVFFHQLTSRRSKVTGDYGKLTCDFRRIPHIFNEYDLIEWENTIMHTAKRMGYAIKHNEFPQQYDACYQFGKCQFSDICEQEISIDKLLTGYVPEGYVIKPRQESYEKVECMKGKINE